MQPSHVPLSITGLGLRLPGASSLSELEALLAAGRVMVAPLPNDRLDRELFFRPGFPTPGFSATELGAVVTDSESNVCVPPPAAEAWQSVDAAHRVFLHTAIEALNDAGWDRATLAGRRVGVVVAHSSPSDGAGDLFFAQTVEDLARDIPDLPELSAIPAPDRESLAREIVRRTRERNAWPQVEARRSLVASGAAHLVAEHFDLRGPCWVVDAACASSLAALYLAQRLIALGQIEMALVGGCSFTQWSSQVLFSQAGALSPTGSFPFDARADGFVSADGYVAAVVEPVDRARARGHTPYAVVRRIAGACDGRGKSLWAPAVHGQVAAIRRCYGDELSPATVQVIEAHCTGTQVGDATEAEALTKVFGPSSDGRKIPVASVKGNIGHARETAGLAGLLRLLIAMRSGVVPPAAGFQNPSPAIAWESSPLRVPREAEPWPDVPGQPRRGAVSSMGIGGLNYHAVLEEPSAEPASLPAPSREGTPVAVIGIGLLHPHADSLEGLLGALRSPPDPLPAAAARWDTGGVEPSIRPSNLHHTLDAWMIDWRRHRLPPRQIEVADPLHLMFLEATARAIESVGWYSGNFPLHRETAVFVGTGFGSDFSVRVNTGLRAGILARDLRALLTQQGVEEFAARAATEAALKKWRQRYPISDEWGAFSPSTYASRIAKHFDLGGPCATLDAGEDSPTAAMLAAVSALSAGDCEVALCCSGQRFINPVCARLLEEAGWNKLDRPLVLTDAAVILVLQRADQARRSGLPVLAVIDHIEQGFRSGNPWDALAACVADSEQRGEKGKPTVLALPGIDPVRETAALNSWADAQEQLSVAPALGFGQGASGLLALLSAVAAGSRAANGGEVTFAACSVSVGGSAGVVRGRVKLHETHTTPGQGRRVRAAEKGPARLVRLGAPDAESLARRLREAQSNPRQAWQEAANDHGFQERDDWRLATVADSPAALAARLAQVPAVPAPVSLWPSLHEQGVFLTQCPHTPPRTAVLFSGQASQYPGMLRGLVETSPAARAALREVDRALADHGEPNWQGISWEQPLAERLGKDTWLTQAAVLGADLIAWAALAALGVRPDVTAGHSLGEFAALVAAGAWDIGGAVDATRTRCRILQRLGHPPGCLVSTSAGDAIVAEIQEALGGKDVLAPAVRNSPEQLILAVRLELLDQLVEELQRRGEAAHVLPVPMPYHSRLLAPVQEAWESEVGRMPLSPPRLPFLSWVDASYVAEPEEIRHRLALQNLAFLDFERLVRRLWEDGVRVVIEAGPRSVLTRLVRSILRGHPVLALATDQSQTTAHVQLLRVRAMLETQGLTTGDRQTGLASASIPYRLTRTLPRSLKENVLHVDATAGRRSRMSPGWLPRAEPTTPPQEKSPAATPPVLDELEETLVQFVCEQTGYPRELVGLDLDLEAELGIDSLRKAQMLLEARDRFSLSTPVSASGLTLGRLATLRDVARLVRELRSSTPPGPAEAPTEVEKPAHHELLESDSDRPPPLPEGQTMRRWVARTYPLTLPRREDRPAELATLVAGPASFGDILLGSLHSALNPVTIVPDAAACRPLVCREPIPRRLVVATSLAEDTDWFAEGFEFRRGALHRHGVQVVLAVREWVSALRKRGLLEGSELLFLTGLGGGPGPVPGRRLEPAGGGLLAFGRSLRHEFPEMRIGMIDVTADEPSARAARAAVNWLGVLNPPEYGQIAGTTFQNELLAADLPIPLSGAPPVDLGPALSPGAAWLVTGGGRGITAHASRAVARRFGLYLHIVGRTSPDPVPAAWLSLNEKELGELREGVLAEAAAAGDVRGREEQAWEQVQARIELHQTLAAHKAAGVQYTYFQADVADGPSVVGLLERIRASGRPLSGILHGAGGEHSIGIEKKSEEVVVRTIQGKVLGLQNLLALTREAPIRAVVAFSSVVALTGNHGQSDYALANGLMAAIMARYRETRPETRVTTIHWGPWKDVGMAVRGTGGLAIAASGQQLLPIEEGCQHLIRELESGLTEPEIVILDRLDALVLPGGIRTSSRSQVCAGNAADRPALLDTLILNSNGRPDCGEILLNPNRHPWLRDHTLDGIPLVPATAMLEMMAEAVLGSEARTAGFCFEDVEILAALRVPHGRECLARISCREVDGIWETRLVADRLTALGELAEAQILAARSKLTAVLPGVLPVAPVSFPAEDDPGWKAPDPKTALHETPSRGIGFGPTMGTMKLVQMRQGGGYAILEWPQSVELHPVRPHAALLTPLSLVDGCLVACGTFCWEVLGVLCLPLTFSGLCFNREAPPGARCRLVFELVRQEEHTVEMSFHLFDNQGNPLLWCRRLGFNPVREAGKR